jgi:histidinol-phosphate aminotransferase
MSHEYERVPTADGLRLHLNENTAGCSPRVLEVLRQLTREDAAFYPDYDRVVQAVADRFDIDSDQLLLTNGLDEGILLTAIIGLRGSVAADPFEAIIVEPAFDMYAACADAMGGRIVTIPPEADFSFPLPRVVQAITPKTRLIFLTSPNNPTGISIPRDAIARVAAAAPRALLLLDEAYADFACDTMMHEAASGRVPNLIVGRTFAKAYGLAGLRAGALVGSAEQLASMRRVVPPYTLNAWAAAALPAALEDEPYHAWYLEEVRQSKNLLYDVLARYGIRFWKSDGNFVLACFGSDLTRVIARLAGHGIIIRDRSRDPGCEGCARMTAGVVTHTRQLVTALEEVLCGAA